MSTVDWADRTAHWAAFAQQLSPASEHAFNHQAQAPFSTTGGQLYYSCPQLWVKHTNIDDIMQVLFFFNSIGNNNKTD